MMAPLTFYKPTGEWGIEGVDLATLPPKVYSALCKLHDLEHHQDMALAHVAKMYGLETNVLEDVILWLKHIEDKCLVSKLHTEEEGVGNVC